jgi:NAD(P)H dehydrogenase (quinone)
MQTHIVNAHPDAASYNGALIKTARQTLRAHGHKVSASDLYQSGFDPVESSAHYSNRADPMIFSALQEQRHGWQTRTLPIAVQDEINALTRADLVILQFPLWWHGPPAILKGWMDRVFVSGGLYTSRMRYDTGYFKGKRALISVTTGAPRNAFGPGRRGGDFDTMLWPLHYSLHYMGFSVLPPYISYGVQGHGYSYEDTDCLQTRLSQNLTNWQNYLVELDEVAPLSFPGWADWDADGQTID